MFLKEPVPIVHAPVYGPLARNEYRCDACGGIYSHGWTEEEARAEQAATFPWLQPEDATIVCDDCYRAVMGLGVAS
jgi:hypothetical protein